MRIRGASLAVVVGAPLLAAVALAQQGDDAANRPNPAMTPRGLSINQWGQPCVPIQDAKAPAEAAPPARRGGATGSAAPVRQKPREPALPAPDVRMRVVAPGPRGAWLFRIDNEGSHTVRIPADARLLSFEVDPREKGRRPVTCALPAPLRPTQFPDARQLYLEPGQSYVEPIDPELYCFGRTESAALGGGALVRPIFGFPARGGRGSEPFAIDSIVVPSPFASLEQIAGPTMLLSHGVPKREVAPVGIPGAPAYGAPPRDAASGMERPRGAEPSSQGGVEAAPREEAPAPAGSAAPTSPGIAKPRAPSPTTSGQGGAAAPAPSVAPPAVGVTLGPGPANQGAGASGASGAVFDEKAPRLDLTVEPFSEAGRPARATVTITAKNLGRRAMRVLLRPRMMAFRVDGPDGVVLCDPPIEDHAVPPDMYSTLGPGATRTMTVLLSEVCPNYAFQRPGLYRITPTVHAHESGEDAGVHAYTGVATAKRPALLRLLTGSQPFHASPPRAVSTASLAPRDEAEEP